MWIEGAIEMKIFVNGEAHEWSASIIDYGVVLAMAKEPAGATVTYSCPRDGDTHRSGMLHAKSEPIIVADGMRIECIRTGNA
jgi:hypothetical protein